jgi:HKD family nuclease
MFISFFYVRSKFTNCTFLEFQMVILSINLLKMIITANGNYKLYLSVSTSENILSNVKSFFWLNFVSSM